ncbi:MAG: FMN-binding negative transcriptional regulator [Steroidobacteraceae bacterium]
MYLPAHFREERREVLQDFVERHPLGALVTVVDGRAGVDHIPMLLERDAGALGRLRGHVARANPIARMVPDGADVLVVFAGADAYVTPSAYPAKRVDGRVVPTWNYAVVHARGRIRWSDDPVRLGALVAALTDHHEAARPDPWAVSDAPPDYVAAMLRAITGFEIAIESLDGKFKASQNRSEGDRAGVAGTLARERDPGDVGELVRAPTPRDG